MASYVLDTHAIVYNLVAPRKLGRRARAVLRRVDQGRDEALIPAAAVAEIALLHELGRVRIGIPELRAVLESVPSVRFLPLELEQLDEFAALLALRDPFDRLIVSAARASGAKLITRDSIVARSGLVEVVWE